LTNTLKYGFTATSAKVGNLLSMALALILLAYGLTAEAAKAHFYRRNGRSAGLGNDKGTG
jgi:hypothetical protein